MLTKLIDSVLVLVILPRLENLSDRLLAYSREGE